MAYDIISVCTGMYWYVLVCTGIYCCVPIRTDIHQVEFIDLNKAIDNAKAGSHLRGLPHVADPRYEVEEVLIKCMDGKIASRQSRIPESELPDLHQKAVDLLDILQQNLPDKTGEKSKWKFEKAHSILHKVREIVLWGNTDNTSCQAKEVCVALFQYIPACTGTYQFILVHRWLWKFGRGKPRLGGLTVEETALKKDARRDEQAKRSVETHRRRKADKA